MTVKELKEKLSKFDDNTEIQIFCKEDEYGRVYKSPNKVEQFEFPNKHKIIFIKHE